MPLLTANFRWVRSFARRGRLATDLSGATAIEYALIAGLISIAIIGGATAFGSSLTAEWLYVANVVNPQLSH